MNKYTIYCTEEQTRKALELGAPINSYTEPLIDVIKICKEKYFIDDGFVFMLPTAEEMIGWLEEQESIISIEVTVYDGYWQGYVETTNYKDAIGKNGYSSRKEATIATIGAALVYLTNNKKCL